MATLRDIALRAGVAVSTVSRVLNARPDVSVTEPVRERILSAAQELGYRPNHYARGLVRGRGTQIALVFWSAAYQIASRRLRAVEHALVSLGHPVVSTDAASLPPGPEPLLDLLTSQLPEAVVSVGVTLHGQAMAEVLRVLQEREVHCIVADLHQYVGTELPCDVVYADREQGVNAAMNHLLGLGHRDIGLVHWKGDTYRYRGYERPLEAAGIDARYLALTETAATDDDYYALGSSAAERTRELLERHPQITALFCRNDLLALGAMQGLHSLGLRVPEDISVVGFDNDPWTALLPVPLTTMASPLDELGERVTQLLGARLAGDHHAPQHVRLAYRLVVRQSTGPVRPDLTPEVFS